MSKGTSQQPPNANPLARSSTQQPTDAFGLGSTAGSGIGGALSGNPNPGALTSVSPGSDPYGLNAQPGTAGQNPASVTYNPGNNTALPGTGDPNQTLGSGIGGALAGAIGNQTGMTAINNPGASSGLPVGSSGTSQGSNPNAFASYGLGQPAGPQTGQTTDVRGQSMDMSAWDPAVQAQQQKAAGTYQAGGGVSSTNTSSSSPVSSTPQSTQTGIDPNQLAQATTAAGNSSPMGGGGNISSAIQNAQNAAYQNATGYLDPQFAEQQNTLTNQLVNQGVPQGSEAWNKAQDDFARQKQFAYSQAQSGAYGQGLTAQNQIANQLLTSQGINTQANTAMGVAGIGANTAANQLAEQANTDTFNQSMSMRNQNLNELQLQQQNPLTMYNSVTNGTSPTQPNFTNSSNSNVAGTDIASIISQALGQQNNVYNSQVGSTNSANSGMASILAALISDRRLKTNIVKIGMHVCGVPLYTYNYVWGEPGIGVMADELEKVRPDAVLEVFGIKVVNYGAIS